MDKKQCILNYAQRQTPIDLSTLGFTIIKTDKQFQKAYKMHDVACTYVVHQYLWAKYVIYPIGVDLRQHRVIIKDELPDYLAEKGGEVFCFDVKAKSSTKYFGWVNERAALSYRKLAETCNVPVYLNFVQVIGGKVRGKLGYCNIEDEPIKQVKAWNGNIVWVYKWEKGLARV
ncbi:hypothetical protein J7L49_03750 [Candidatus Bathyarchaeota archaeon]|nr:hypothetical protein [Candidatus Bathyarchaeota archaeon]